MTSNCDVPIVAVMNEDAELQELIEQYKKVFGTNRPFSIWEDGSIENYKENLKKSIKEHRKL